ncbi:metallopeptidase family M24 [Colletotrichum karsti]|uniref:Metallopeptidase family M24 n=1 Tax=Colletotrichum karsti TaxID=1095194 RepID=A0A9P6I0U2_9PEZI|nr:metallopeptidase family M24 [Colletotrichum karsti]KAF9874383.1 metallopeptidase family M24 [Colletotrichum karsti]
MIFLSLYLPPSSLHAQQIEPRIANIILLSNYLEMSGSERKQQTASRAPARPPQPPTRRSRLLPLVATSLFLLATSFYSSSIYHYNQPTGFQKVQQCAIDNLKSDLSFLNSAVPIAADEFIERRDRLAKALAASNIDAFALEPGYTFQYYGNISQVDWEPWEPEERPFLMLVMPQTLPSGEITGKTAFLSPHFEEGRVRMLGIPSRDEELDIVIWEEHWNPYSTLLKSRLFDGRKAKIMVDEEMRDFIVRGLDSVGFETVGLNPEVELVRQQKSPAEVELLRAVNTGTVVAVRAMRPCLVPGLTENDVTDILNNALLSIDFSLFFNIVLFEEHGALPHGGFVTGWKKLTPESMVVIDVGAHYLGYSSDICRSFFIDPPETRCNSAIGKLLRWFGSGKSYSATHENKGDSELRAEKLKVWDIVLDAQTAAASAFKPNNTAASVDIAARQVIENAGYGYGFTHRLGHGIGIKAHESPYLNKWNKDVLLQPGMTFTNEPGIYLENRFGVRHEDIYLVRESGEAELLTGRRATGPYDP